MINKEFKSLSGTIILFLLLVGCQINPPQVIFSYVDPLEKVFPESNYFAPVEARADVARGEHASFQFAVRSNQDISDLRIEVIPPNMEGDKLEEVKKGFVEFVKVGRTNPDPSKDMLSPSSGYFPDPIVYKESKDVRFGTTQPVWISIKVPIDAKPGSYFGKVIVNGRVNDKSFLEEREIKVEVYEPVIDKTSLWVTNWFFLDRLSYLNNNQPVEKHSELYWDLSRVMARALADYRQNVAMISPFDHTMFSKSDGAWKFDFSNFNKMVDLFIEEGVIGRLEVGHLGGRLDGSWTGPFGLNVPIIDNDSIDKEMLPLNDHRTQSFYDSFLPALVQNIREKGWFDRYMQHIADEPIDANVESYIEISKYLKKLVPDLKVIEACHSHQLENMIDVWVPQMNFLNEGLDFYTEQQNKGSESWYYTCLAPKGEYANRFVELPLIKTRLLHWVNYKYNIPGYLHWGFNYWGSRGGIATGDDPFDDVSGMILSSGNILPGGDCWISYPGEKEIFPSIRLEAMRDGIVDYDLLKRYQQKHPEEAKDLVGTTVYGFEHYDINIPEFRKKRRKILEALSE